jgi:hypothetical protein
MPAGQQVAPDVLIWLIGIFAEQRVEGVGIGLLGDGAFEARLAIQVIELLHPGGASSA